MNIAIISLGCPKNQVDADVFCHALIKAGHQTVADPEQADIIIVNTCGFIQSAKEEAIENILMACQYKQQNPNLKVIVTGCLAERYKTQIVSEMPEVDAVVGIGSNAALPAIVERLTANGAGQVESYGPKCDMELGGARVISTPRHYAYLKIAEGCNNRCHYCAIPLIRGGHVSVPMEELEEEARKLAAGGVKELIVIAQDTTYYGLDLYGKRRLAELLRRLCRIDGIEWIRLHYAYPTAFPDEVIEAMASEPKICKYLDIPFQHISDAQLSAMHRRHTKAEAYALVKKLRGAIPDLALRTTLLVGYPGKTEADFTELEQFVRDVRFERLGVFAYSEEEGTYSARELADDVPEEVKQQRVERIMTLQNDIARENNLRRVGRTERVLIDSRQGDYYVGRTQYDSPEVDQEILIPAAERRLLRGHFYEIRIDGAADYDLYGKAVGK